MKNQNNLRSECASEILESIFTVRRSIFAYYYHELGKTVELTPGQYQVLYQIKKGKNTIRDLAACIKVSAPTVSRQVESLVSKGMVTRTQSKIDRRVQNLEVTENGLALLESARDKTDSWVIENLKDLNDEQLSGITQSLAKLRVIFEADCQK